ncbi:hypothetical protein ZMTM_05100 [Methyloradius palustris]|uniref:Acyltransferase n=2 Tax=Methyloradius palustris TaxID=2778876 RepID=A0A8D5JQ84_9PROT|nr:hypothetical protein ZMTM_05100 [Methyloradius palustris]
MIPILCVLFTLLRVFYGMHHSVISHFRVDEILVGGILALIFNNQFINTDISNYLKTFLSKINLLLILIMFLISCHPAIGWMEYVRPYLAALLVGSTLFNLDSGLKKLLNHRVLGYIATISFALYVLHPLLASTWLGSGDLIEKYAKRPLLLAAVLIAAHVSTFYYEKRWINFGKYISELISHRTQ